MSLWVIMDDDTEEAIPVEANSMDEAYAKAQELTGRDVRAWPAYNLDDPDNKSIEEVVATLKINLEKKQ